MASGMSADAMAKQAELIANIEDASRADLEGLCIASIYTMIEEWPLSELRAFILAQVAEPNADG